MTPREKPMNATDLLADINGLSAQPARAHIFSDLTLYFVESSCPSSSSSLRMTQARTTARFASAEITSALSDDEGDDVTHVVVGDDNAQEVAKGVRKTIAERM